MVAHRKKQEDALVLALACGATVEAAAKQCGVCERTVSRRLKDPKFKRRLAKVQADIVERTVGALTAASMESVRTLLDLQKLTTPSATRLGAAKAVLELGMKAREASGQTQPDAEQKEGGDR